MNKSNYTITAPLWRWNGGQFSEGAGVQRFTLSPSKGGGWYFVTVPHELFTEIRAKYGKGLLHITATINDISWETSLLPETKSQTYLIAIKKSVRAQAAIVADDIITLYFKLDSLS